VTELHEASKDLAGQYRHTQAGEKLGQRMLLSERKFDSDGLTHDISSMDFEAVVDAAEKLESTDIEGYLAHHHDIIILGAVEDARRAAEDDAQTMERRWAASNWKSAREEFLQNLGHRSQGWTGGGGGGRPEVSARDSARKGAISESMAFESARDQYREEHEYGASSGASAGRLLFSPQSAKKKPEASAQKSGWSVGGGAPAPAPAPLPRPLQEHASVIRRLNRTTFGTKDSGGGTQGHHQQLSTLRFRMSPASELLDCVQDCSESFGALSPQGFASMKDLIGYRTCLQMLGDMVTGGGHTTASSSSNTPGYFSPLCLSEDDIARDSNSILISNAVMERRRVMSAGAKTFFERQHEELLMESVTEHVSQNGAFQTGISAIFRQSNGGSHHLGTKILMLQNFLELKRRAGSIPAVSMQATIPLQSGDGNRHPGTPLWPLVVLCLRIGDLEAAADVLRLVQESDGGGGGGVESEIVYALDGFIALGAAMMRSGVGHAGGDGDGDELSVPEFRRRFQGAVTACRDLFLAAQQAVSCGGRDPRFSSGVPNAYYDPYRMDVLNFLSLSSVNDISDDVYGAGSLEDYLWCNLWFVQWTRELLGSGVMTSAPAGHGAGAGGRGRDCESGYKPAMFSESDVYESIMEAGGEEYFDNDGTLPYKYATVLLTCQCVGEAILHLWKIAKSFAAAHLTALALHYGMIFPHIPLASTGNISSGSELYGYGGPGGGKLNRASLSITAGEILQRWTKMNFQNGHAEDATDYLLCLNMSKSWVNIQCNAKFKSTLQVHCQELLDRVLVDLISSSGPAEISTLLGDIAAPSTGMCRGIGVLDDYFERSYVDLLLSRAAYSFITVHRNPEEALRLYYLGGRYVEVVEELCNQLSLHFVPASSSSQSSGKRKYWIEAAVQFFTCHLRIGAAAEPLFVLHGHEGTEKDSAIRKSIEQHGRLELLLTFCTLLNLSYFVELVSEKR
jgi:hypothetical protein